MPLYYFRLKSRGEVIHDLDGIDLPDQDAARVYAVAVARELMRHREPSARSWRLEVCDDYLIPSFEILFAEVDDTMAHLAPEYRKSIEIIARRSASLDDAFSEVRASMLDVRETLARADDVIAATSKTGAGRRLGDGR